MAEKEPALPAPPERSEVGRYDPIGEQRRMVAVRMFLEGHTYDEIALELGYSCRQNALRAVNAQLARMVEEDVTEFRRRELQHLQELREALRTRIEQGDPQAVTAALKVSERVARMLGLDKPAKVDIHSTKETRQIHTVQINMPPAPPVIDVTPQPAAIEGKGEIDGEYRDGDPGHVGLALRQEDEELQPGGLREAV